ncbi:MAG: F0F1 ATP synthase subunit delta [Patescibacteria group bacterium]|nr:F0F1 ATP synthase subunit delta [Patescibacteria group bacterium]
MKYSHHLYARALADVIVDAKGAEAERFAGNFLALVRKNGDEAHLRKILEEAARLLRGKKGVRKVTLGTARQLPAGQREMLKVFLKPGDVIEERIDPELVAGVRITVDDEWQFDGSLKGKLDKLFKS